MVHAEAVLNKLTKPELIQLLLKTEAIMGSQIPDMSNEDCKHQTCSAGKTPSIPDETLWRLLTFLIVLIKMLLRKRCVVFSKRFILKLTNGIFNFIIA